MNIENIKVGETYNVRVKVIGKYSKGIDAIYADADDAIAGLHIPERRVGILRPISPENGIKNTETAPKYDPCRWFREGDRVEVKQYKGRLYTKFWAQYLGQVLAVGTSETETSSPELITKQGLQPIDPAYLELITPVEEIEQYFIQEDSVSYNIRSKDECLIAAIVFKGICENPMQLAKDTCARLNAEYRKEQA